MAIVSRAVAPRRPPSPRRLARRRRRWPLLVPLAVLAGWGIVRLMEDPPATAAVPTSAGPPPSTIVSFATPTGERSTSARCWMVVIDESGSMATADASGARADAVRAAGEFLAAYGIAGDRIGVTWFAERSKVEPPTQPSVSARAPVAPLDLGGGTIISAALDATFDAMDAACGTTQRVVVLVSDGDATTPDEFAATAATIAARGRGAGIHLVAMNGDGAFEGARAFWQNDALGISSVRTIDTFAGDEVAAAMADILALETGQQVTPR